MKNRVCIGLPALALLLVQLSFSTHAFTLGNLRGSAVIGRPLDVSIQVQSDVGEAISSQCVTAQVSYSDARQSSVTVSVVPGAGSAQGAVVQVRAPAAVNEPVVTLEVSATCGSNTRRNYVLLADFPPLTDPSVSLLSTPGVSSAAPVVVLPTVSSSEPGTSALPTQAPRAGSAKPALARTTPTKASVKPASSALQASAVEKPVVRKAPARASGQSVLKLDPSDFLSDRIDLLDSTSLFAPTEDALRHSRQITSLESDVKTLRAVAASNDARMSDLNAKLQQAQENQMPPWLVYALAGLVALVLACLAAVFWLWMQLQRRRQHDVSQGWWHGPEGAREEGPPTELLVPAAPAAPAPVAPTVQIVATPPTTPPKPVVAVPFDSTTEVDIDLGFELLQESLHGNFEVSTGSAPFELNSIRHISVEPILDIRQQAEFFVSLGQTDRALQILNKQIAESAEPNPLVCLDLITLYHSLGLKAEFRERREAFQKLFNVVIPDFPVFNLEGHDLESYPEVLANLVSLWPRLDALAFLSACIFRDANAQHGGTFDLAAFRDLLMLHALAEALLPVQPQSNEFTESADASSTMAFSFDAQRARPADATPARMLDIDFSAPTEPMPPPTDK